MLADIMISVIIYVLVVYFNIAVYQRYCWWGIDNDIEYYRTLIPFRGLFILYKLIKLQKSYCSVYKAGEYVYSYAYYVYTPKQYKIRYIMLDPETNEYLYRLNGELDYVPESRVSKSYYLPTLPRNNTMGIISKEHKKLKRIVNLNGILTK